MSKKKRTLITIVVALLMISIMSAPVFADGEVELTEEVETVEETSKFLDHPIVKLFAEFFDSFFNPPVEEDPALPEVGTSPDDSGTEGEGTAPEEGDPPEEDGAVEEVGEPAPPPVVPEEEIASMHEEDKLGFGEIAKLTGIANMAQISCAENGDNCEVTLDSLIEEYKDGMGVGNLFKKYGKPENLGVGQIKKELDPKEKTNNGKSKNK